MIILQKSLFEQTNNKFLLYQSAGIFLSLYSILVYKRMLGLKIIGFQYHLIFDSLLLTGGTFLFSWIGVNQSLTKLAEIRKNCLLKTDINYMKHIITKYQKYQYFQKNEFLVFSDIFTIGEYKEWKEQNKFDITMFKPTQ